MMPEIQKLFDHVHNGEWQLPFLTMAGIMPRFNWARIIEAITIAIIAGMFANYVTVQRLQADIDYMKRDMVKMEERLTVEIDKVSDKVDKMYNDLYGPIRLTP
jgi:hypothetical protein